jgi:hypothetical protein
MSPCRDQGHGVPRENFVSTVTITDMTGIWIGGSRLGKTGRRVPLNAASYRKITFFLGRVAIAPVPGQVCFLHIRRFSATVFAMMENRGTFAEEGECSFNSVKDEKEACHDYRDG